MQLHQLTIISWKRLFNSAISEQASCVYEIGKMICKQDRFLQQRLKMNRKVAPEVYLPNNSKSYTYYPIEQKKHHQQSISQRHQTTIRMERPRDRDLDALRKTNEQLREREEIYIEKLMKLEQGLENQHQEFVKLQELYTELFESYKQKQIEISQLEFKYRESSRRHYLERNNGLGIFVNNIQNERKEQQRRQEMNELQLVGREKDWLMRQAELMQMNENLTQKLLSMNQNYEKVLQQLNALRSKEKAQNKGTGNDKIIAEAQEWQQKAQLEKENCIKYQYQNQFLKNRNKDLQAQREELQKLLAYKQKEIGKLRQEKIHIHRQTSQRLMNRSLSNSSRVLKTIPSTSNRDQNEPCKDPKAAIRQSKADIDQSMSQDYSKLQQYFSFSRDKKDHDLEEGLPSFPPQLQIDSLISEHKQ